MADWPVAVEEFHAGAVGLFFLRALIGQAASGGSFPAGRGWPRAGLPTSPPLRAAATMRADAEQHGDDRRGLRLRELLAQPRQMAAGDVAGLVREHADDLVRRLGVDQRAGVDEDAPAVHHEGVERAVVDDDDLDVLLREAGGAQDRLRVVAQQLLDLGVADDRQPGGRLCARAGVGATPRSERRRAQTPSAARARARLASVRRALIGLSAFDHVRSGSRAQCSANLVAPPDRVNATRITSIAHPCRFVPSDVAPKGAAECGNSGASVGATPNGAEGRHDA